MPGLQAVQLGFSVAFGCFGLLIAFGVLVLAVVHRNEVRDTWTAGAAASTMVLLLTAPMQVLTLVHLDLTVVFAEIELPASQLADMLGWAWWASLAGAVVAGALSFVYRVLLVPVAVAADPRKSPYPLLLGDVGALRGLFPGLLVGGFFGVVSVLMFWLLGVTESELAREQLAWFPGVDWHDPGVVFGVTLPTLIAAAITEELVFRGVMQRWITTWLGGRWVGGAVAIVVTSGVWTLGHAANTDQVVLKFVQIFGLGLLFGTLSHRYSVESSLTAHITLNVIAVVGGFALGM